LGRDGLSFFSHDITGGTIKRATEINQFPAE
jgi:hypothetical protein